MNFSDFDAVAWSYQLVHRDLYLDLEPSNPDPAASGAAGIVLTSSEMQVLSDVANEIKDDQRISKVLAHPADLRSEDSVKELWDKAKAIISKISVLVNDARTTNYAPTSGTEPSLWWNDFVFYLASS
ncbi:hypothetical protein F4679DRAFT_598239 [Xylaria curta]|nr:hypothetical protein F4679DRAFT_598239 [Xylaria curta]